jgi:hypothetical protein
MNEARTDQYLAIHGVMRMKGLCSCSKSDIFLQFERVAIDIPADKGTLWARECGTQKWTDTPQARAVIYGKGFNPLKNKHLDPEKVREQGNETIRDK